MSHENKGLGDCVRSVAGRLAGAGYSALEGVKNYTDWNIGGTLNVPEWFSLDLRYYDSDLRSAGGFADDRFVVKISRAF